ncbi:Similar to Tim9a: Mitochondrial import inner membrane translocase subunit Tim9 (Drosophila melanogaster) [Cotesia congregata]|uniref:Mitochondrial import inner membrane translocase subunit n=1 Tax=Cotesia congregata TaxID=51543 RepID=A0A8J2MML9_COTCN|nr:Similar to Tim9a: Mitochondrial import inner membrane translocase subunit Tim9 (Drosophila melanogaster) [Cotesia congregata]
MAMAGTSVEAEVEAIKSFRDFLTSYNKLSEVCFIDCISDFTSRDLKSKEEKCAVNCMEKYLKMNQRVSQRFQDIDCKAGLVGILSSFVQSSSHKLDSPNQSDCSSSPSLSSSLVIIPASESLDEILELETLEQSIASSLWVLARFLDF